MPALALLAVIAILAFCIEQTHGHYKAAYVPVVLVAWLGSMAILTRPVRWAVPEWLTRHARPTVLLATLGWTLFQLQILLTTRQDSDARHFSARGEVDYATCLWGVLVALTALGLASWPARIKHVLFAVLVGLHLKIGLSVLAMAVDPQIDVWTLEMEAAKALVAGVNPFAITWPDPYHGTSPFFPPGVSVDGRLQFGFVYPPLCLLLCLPGYLLAGDTRWATLLAMTVAAGLMAYATPDSKRRDLGMLAAALFLFTPRTFFVAHRAWTDTFVVMLTALVVFCASRYPRYLYIAAGLYCCVKQHMFIAAPALILLLPRPWSVRQIVIFFAKAAGVSFAVTLPLVLWNVRAFINSVLNIREVFRTDSLGMLAYLNNEHGIHLSKWTGIGFAFAACALGVWRAPRTPSGFALVAGCTHLSLYLFSTHAFCNEYYNVIGSFCVALAVAHVPAPSEA